MGHPSVYDSVCTVFVQTREASNYWSKNEGNIVLPLAVEKGTSLGEVLLVL